MEREDGILEGVENGFGNDYLEVAMLIVVSKSHK